MATNAVVQSQLYQRTQMIRQFFFIWLLPLLGALIVLYMIRGHRIGWLESTGGGFWAGADNWFWAALGTHSVGHFLADANHQHGPNQTDYAHHHHSGHDSHVNFGHGDGGGHNDGGEHH